MTPRLVPLKRDQPSTRPPSLVAEVRGQVFGDNSHFPMVVLTKNCLPAAEAEFDPYLNSLLRSLLQEEFILHAVVTGLRMRTYLYIGLLAERNPAAVYGAIRGLVTKMRYLHGYRPDQTLGMPDLQDAPGTISRRGSAQAAQRRTLAALAEALNLRLDELRQRH